jgi:mevalonate kinase
MGGSGYDVACAGNASPIVYHIENDKAHWQQVEFNPPFKQQLYFVYTGQKQLSSTGIKYYQEKVKNKSDYIQWLNRLTESMLQCQSLSKMEQIINEHESLIAEALELPKVKDRLFADYWGAVKSLGAWGGDFVMLTNDRTEEELGIYLKEKGLSVFMGFDAMINTPY